MVKIIVFALWILHSSCWAMTLKGPNQKIYQLKLIGKTMICEMCTQDQLVYQHLKKKSAPTWQKLINQSSYHQTSISTKLCMGLKGQIWLLEDEKNQEYSLCEFSDQSYLLTDDLAKIAREMGVN